MDYGLIFAPTALGDFEEIIGALDCDDANAGSHFAQGLLDHVDLLRRFPRLESVIQPAAHIAARKLLEL